MALIEDLMSQFGLSTPQAEGAIGAIGRAAQGKLAPEHLAEIGKLIPGLDRMTAAAPKPGGMLGGLGGMLGGSLGEAAQLKAVFTTLGIDGGKLMPIAKVVLGFLTQNGSTGLQAAIAPWAAKLGLA